ncbi:MAG TPA: ribokinase [Bacteroidales bacterium]|jgi:sugar/nucleoside kinase (ribokinase family)|nr:ribokinase [Bacteroidales bacterium]
MTTSKKILFVGLNTVDMQFFVNGFPKPNTKTKAKQNEIAAGGPATNAAIACAALGSQTELLSPIGKHSLSRFLINDIIKHGVQLLDPIRDIDSKPIFASIITDEINGERTIFSYHPEVNHTLLIEELELENYHEYSMALFDGFYPDLAIPIAELFKQHGITTVLDGGSWKSGLSELLPFIDIAICSSDFYVPGTNSISDLFESLKDYDIQKIAITQGADSIVCFNKKKVTELVVPQVKAVDTLGAGDFIHGAFCHYYALESNFELALQKASVVASESCTFNGTRSWLQNIDAIKKTIEQIF